MDQHWSCLLGEIKKREMIRGQTKKGGGKAQRDEWIKDERLWRSSATIRGREKEVRDGEW